MAVKKYIVHLIGDIYHEYVRYHQDKEWIYLVCIEEEQECYRFIKIKHEQKNRRIYEFTVERYQEPFTGVVDSDSD
jgi:hypothetical protein